MEWGIELYSLLATVVLVLHLAFVAWVMFGSLLTRHKPLLGFIHAVSLAWAVIVESGPWSCPLTVAENWLELRSGRAPYQGGFMLHYLDKIVYPEIPPDLLTAVALCVVSLNVVIYAARVRHRQIMN